MPGPAYPGKPREHQQEPIVPAKDGQPPAWVVSCLDCGFAHDAHGLTAGDAVKAIAPNHQDGHRLIARSIDYTAGWERPGRPFAGVAASTGGHPLYFP